MQTARGRKTNKRQEARPAQVYKQNRDNEIVAGNLRLFIASVTALWPDANANGCASARCAHSLHIHRLEIVIHAPPR